MIPVLTQGCTDSSLVPLGVVAARGASNDDFNARVSSLLDTLRSIAPEGTYRMYNLRLEPRDYHGHRYLEGTADAYAAPVAVNPGVRFME